MLLHLFNIYLFIYKKIHFISFDIIELRTVSSYFFFFCFFYHINSRSVSLTVWNWTKSKCLHTIKLTHQYCKKWLTEWKLNEFVAIAFSFAFSLFHLTTNIEFTISIMTLRTALNSFELFCPSKEEKKLVSNSFGANCAR